MRASSSFVQLALLVSILSIFLQQTKAYENGAESCEFGPAIAGSSTLSNEGSGELEDGGFEVYLDGELLETGGPYLFQPGEDLRFELSSSEGTYDGFLIRIGDARVMGVETVATAGELAVIEPALTKISDVCLDQVPSIAGITNVNNDEKSDPIEVIFNSDGDRIIDVTVVVGEDWYHSSYQVEADLASSLLPTPSDTLSSSDESAAPSSQPSKAGSSGTPTNIPTATPNAEVPTSTPTKAQTLAPVTKAPTFFPTYFPTASEDNATLSPTPSPISGANSTSSDPTASPITPVPTTGAPVSGATSAPTTPVPISPAPISPAPISTSTTPAPISPAPISPAPISTAPISPAPISPAPISTTPISPAPNTPNPISPAPISTSITPAPISTSQAKSCNPADICPPSSFLFNSKLTNNFLDKDGSVTISDPSQQIKIRCDNLVERLSQDQQQCNTYRERTVDRCCANPDLTCDFCPAGTELLRSKKVENVLGLGAARVKCAMLNRVLGKDEERCREFTSVLAQRCCK